MIKEICYEWTLMSMNFLMFKKNNGWFDKKRVYEKISFLNWKVTNINNLKLKD